jgi:hypothetical protein
LIALITNAHPPPQSARQDPDEVTLARTGART